MRVLIVFGLLFFLCACKTPLTYTLKNNVEEEGLELKAVQVYISRKFELIRKISSSDAQIKKGKVKFRDGVYYEIIEFPSGIPGVIDLYGDNAVYVRFERGANKTLKFGYDSKNDRYELSMDGPANSKHKGQVSYGGKYYDVDFSGSRYDSPFLKVKKSSARDYKEDKRKVKGLKVE